MPVPTLTAASPSAGYIAWSSFTIQYLGTAYAISSGNTNLKFTWWLYNAGAGGALQSSNTLPVLSDDDVLLFINKSGLPFNVNNSNVVDGSLIVSGSILADSIGANTILAANIASHTLTANEIAADTITASEIAAGAITASEIATNAVTAIKILAGTIDATKIVADTLTANEIATGAITATELATNSVTAIKILAGTIDATKILADTLTANEIAAGAITATELATNSVTAIKILAGTIDASKILADTITSNEIATNAITANELAANAVIAGKILAGTIVAADIAADTITANQIAANAITSNELAANAVIAGKILAGTIVAADIATDTITANQIAANAITATEIAADAVVARNILAGEIDGGHIHGGSIDGTHIAGNLITGSTISTGAVDEVTQTVTGARVDLGPSGITTYGSDGVTPWVEIPLAGKTVFRGDGEIGALSVTGGASLQGTIAHEVASGSTLKLSSGVTAPTNKPSATVEYTQFTMAGLPGGAAGLVFDGTYYYTAYTTDSTQYVKIAKYNSSGVLQATSANTVFLGDRVDGLSWNGLAAGSGGKLYTIAKQFTTFQIVAWDLSTLAYSSQWGLMPSADANGVRGIGLGFDTVSNELLVAQSQTNAPNADKVKIFRYNFPGTAGNNMVAGGATVTTDYTYARAISSIHYGTAAYFASEFSAARYIFHSSANVSSIQNYQVCSVASNTATLVSTDQWPKPSTMGSLIGSFWNGTNWYGLGSGGTVVTYEAGAGNRWTTTSATDGPTWYASYAWTLSTARTKRSDYTTITMAKRAKLRIRGATLPSGTDGAEFYLQKGSTVPGASATMWTQGTSAATPPQLIITNGVFSGGGTKDISPSTFTDANSAILSSGSIRSSDGLPRSQINGDGTGRLDFVWYAGDIKASARAWSSVQDAGWVACDGASYLRTGVYADLFAAIGTNYGNVDGTHFNVPDARSRHPMGIGTYASVAAGLQDTVATEASRSPIHTHSTSALVIANEGSHTHAKGSYALSSTSDMAAGATSRGSNPITGTSAGGSNHTHGLSGNVDNTSRNSIPFIGFNFFIKL